MQVVVSQTAGLGNQLFQYAAGKYYARVYGGELRVASQPPEAQTSHGSPRTLQLGQYAVKAKIEKRTVIDRLVLSPRRKYALLKKSVCATRRIEVVQEPYERRMFFNRLSVSKQARTAYLIGYWQAYPFVEAVKDELRTEFQLKRQQEGKNLEIAKRIAASKNPVSVHLRRGDYLPTFGIDSILPNSYYDRAVRAITDRFGASTFFVFSDDIPAARQWASNDADRIVVDINDATTGYEDLRLMSQCHNHIIANSSFSWWGAWLNPRNKKHVIAPSRWLEFETKETDIAGPDWQLL